MVEISLDEPLWVRETLFVSFSYDWLLCPHHLGSVHGGWDQTVDSEKQIMYSTELHHSTLLGMGCKSATHCTLCALATECKKKAKKQKKKRLRVFVLKTIFKWDSVAVKNNNTAMRYFHTDTNSILTFVVNRGEKIFVSRRWTDLPDLSFLVQKYVLINQVILIVEVDQMNLKPKCPALLN